MAHISWYAEPTCSRFHTDDIEFLLQYIIQNIISPPRDSFLNSFPLREMHFWQMNNKLGKTSGSDCLQCLQLSQNKSARAAGASYLVNVTQHLTPQPYPALLFYCYLGNAIHISARLKGPLLLLQQSDSICGIIVMERKGRAVCLLQTVWYWNSSRSNESGKANSRFRGPRWVLSGKIHLSTYKINLYS